MSTDDGDIDDPGLKSLRSVWLSMPDEDPPERGLAELMAAARVKADEMTAKPSWWQRFMAAFARPPVLALASVIVLAGGVVVIGSRTSKDEMQVQAPGTASTPGAQLERASEESEQGTATGAAGSAMPPVVAAPAEIAADEAAAPEPKAELAKSVREQNNVKRDEKASRATAVAPKRAAPKKEPSRDDDLAQDKLDITTGAVGGAPDGEARTRGDDAAGAKAGAKAEAADSALPNDFGGGKEMAPEKPTTAPVQDRAPQNTQLHARARAAAARNDCEAVKTTTKRLATLDPAYYKAKVVNDPQLRDCLTVAQ